VLALKQKLFPFSEYHSVHFTGIASYSKKRFTWLFLIKNLLSLSLLTSLHV